MKAIFISILYLQLLFGFSAVAEEPIIASSNISGLEEKIIQLKKRLLDATVTVQRVGVSGSGSGVIINEDGLIMTAAHVITAPGQKLNIILPDGSVHSATALGVVDVTDSGLAQIDTPGSFDFCPMAKEVNYQVNDWVLALGHPGGAILGRPSPLRLGKILEITETRIVSSCKVISGDSGGPLFNLEGEVIGINSAIRYPWSNNFHVSLEAIIKDWDRLLASEHIKREISINDAEAVKVNDPISRQRQQARKILKTQAEEGDPYAMAYESRPYFLYPHEIQDIIYRWGEELDEDKSLIKESFLGLHFNLSSKQAEISEVSAKGSAAIAGLKVGDIIQSLNGKKYTDIINLIKAMKALSSGEKSAIEVMRGGALVKLSILPATRYSRATIDRSFDMLNYTRERDKLVKTEKECFSDPAFNEFCSDSNKSVVEVLRNDKLVAHGLVVSDRGEILTKASMLITAKKTYKYSIRYAEKTYPVKLVSKDNATDLALLKTDEIIEGLSPIEWSDTVPTTGFLTASAGSNGVLLAHGVVIRPIAINQKPTDERVLSATSSTYLGIGLDPDHDESLVLQVTSQSPADIAGILEGDIIMEINGTGIINKKDLKDVISKLNSGDKIKVSLKRGEELMVVNPILQTAKASAQSNSVGSDGQLRNLSKKGGDLSKRRNDFPLCIYHDCSISTKECGSPLMGSDGKAYGINIARNNRFRALALPVSIVKETLKSLRETP